MFTLIAFQFSLVRLLPPVSYLTRADRFLMGSMILVFLALGETILTGKLHGNGREKLALSVDRWSRGSISLFALLFLFTLVI